MFEVPTGPKGESVRKTLITTSHSFPFLKSRIETVRPHKIYDVKPVQVAIEKINGRSRSIEKVLENINKNSEREKQLKNLTDLQLSLQGSVQVTVNAGPLSYAEKFMTEIDNITSTSLRQLKSAFRKFVHVCYLGLEKNKDLIGNDQEAYHDSLESYFQEMVEKLSKLMDEDLVKTSCRDVLKEPIETKFPTDNLDTSDYRKSIHDTSIV